MGWRRFRAHLEHLNRKRAAQARAGTTEPDSWDGYESDAWWAEQKEKRARERGW